MAAAEDHSIRDYLLGRLTEAQEEQVELRLLTDPDFADEFDIVVNEITDDYVVGKFAGEELQQVEEYFFKSPERRNKLKFGLALKAHPGRKRSVVSPEPAVSRSGQAVVARRPKWKFTKQLAIAASIVIVVGAGFGVWRVFIYQSDLNKGLVALRTAFKDERPIEARLADFSYAPIANQRGGPAKVNYAQRDLAASLLLKEVNEHPSAASHHALGQYYLANRELDKAIDQLTKALALDAHNAKIQSDLGAAWLEKGKVDSFGKERGKGIEQFGRSLENLTKALELDPNLLEARFNRALVRQYMFLPQPAQEDWREYLKRDSSSAWADEARRSLKLLEDQKTISSLTKEQSLQNFRRAYEAGDDEEAWLIISRQRDLSGGVIANALIDAHLKMASANELRESQKQLDLLSFAARLERQKAGDLFVHDVAHYLKSASPAQRKSLIEARQLLQQARTDLYGDKPATAAEYLNQAKAILQRSGADAEAVYIEYPIGHAYLAQFKSDLALASFRRAVRNSKNRRYAWLTAQALNATANAEIGRTNYSAALNASQRSLEISERIGDTTGVIKTTGQLAQQYFRFGNYAKSLDLHQKSLAMANTVHTEPIQLWRNYFTIAMPLSAMGLHAAAIEFEKEALRRAEELKMPGTVCRSYSILGLMHASQGNYEAAVKNAAVAIERAEQIPDKRASKEAIAYALLQLGFIHRKSGDFGRAMSNYDEAIQHYRELENFQAFNYVAHKGKLLSCLHQPGCTSVEDEIKICLDLFEEYRSKILEESNRAPFFDTEQDIYDVATDYELSRNNFERAFEYSEQGRARSLLDLTSNEPRQVTGADVRFSATRTTKRLAEIRWGIPAEVQILHYAVLPDKLVIWLISHASFISQTVAIPLTRLNELVRRFLKEVSSPSENFQDLNADASSLYDILIRPIEPSLEKEKVICIVPDKILNYLPFGALKSRESQKYLMTEYRLMGAPSSTMFLVSSALASEKGRTERESLLSVGNPRFSREEFPELPDLPSAAREARQVSQFYDRSRTLELVEVRATKKAVLAAMKHSEVVHFAGHAVMDEEAPLRSKLVLATESPAEVDQSSALPAFEIYGASLPDARLVILSACETGVGRYYRGEGIMGLSRTFLGAQIPLVVASLWRVDSDSTADLMIAFHRYRKLEKLSTVEAIRRAQEEMANGPDGRYRHPYYWAAFIVVGGHAEF